MRNFELAVLCTSMCRCEPVPPVINLRARAGYFFDIIPKVSPETAEIVNEVAKFAPTGQNLSSLGFRVIIRTYQDRIPDITIRRAVFVY